MEVSIEKAFSILDGRLSTKMEDVYEMLNYIYDRNFFTHELPYAMDKLIQVCPDWYMSAVLKLNKIKELCGTNDFETLIRFIKEHYSSPEHYIQLKKITYKL
jgi:hypothetical protein